jgi:hypothetical protein
MVSLRLALTPTLSRCTGEGAIEDGARDSVPSPALVGEGAERREAGEGRTAAMRP